MPAADVDAADSAYVTFWQQALPDWIWGNGSAARMEKSVRPDVPFIAGEQANSRYFSDDAYKGKFDMGWEELRKQTFERQQMMGIIPANTATLYLLLPDRSRIGTVVTEVAAPMIHFRARGKMPDSNC